MAFVIMGLLAFFGKYPWLLVPVLVAGLLWDLWAFVGRRYLQFHQRQQSTPREAELAKASHGAAVLAIVGLGLFMAGAAEINGFLGALIAAPSDWKYAGAAAAVALAVLWGGLWFVTGARRSLAYGGFRDSRIITRAVAKIAFGGVVWLLWNNPPASWPPDLLQWIGAARALPYSRFAIEAVIAWLVVTGFVKLVLVVWARISRARKDVIVDIDANEFDWDEV
jgi:hypothetical protein